MTTTKRPVSRGRCELCKGEFARSAMTLHLTTCLAEEARAAKKTSRRCRLFIDQSGSSAYWLYVETDERTPLAELDGFLRAIWLECCGHMSAFRVGGVTYSVAPMDIGIEEAGMAQFIGPLMAAPSWRYEYDFGSTTELRVRPQGVHEGTGRGVRLLARNLPPEIPCGVCGKPATKICAFCAYDATGWLCAKCSKKHECEDESFLRVVNSPRAGVCAYGE